MTDPRRFKAPFNPKEQIWQEADRLRAAFPAARGVHHDIYAGLQHATTTERFDCISAIPETEHGWVEWQAYEFAGRELVPPDALR